RITDRPSREKRHGNDDVPQVPARPADDLPRHHRADDQPRQQRKDLVARLGGARPEHDLEPAWDEDDRPEEAKAGEEGGDQRDGDRSVPEEAQRQDRLLGSRLDPYEERRE